MIQTLEEFCEWLDPSVSPRILQKKVYWLRSLRFAKKKRKEYCLFWLAKRGGGYRPVASPSPGLKQVQRGILSLLAYGEIAPPATAYRPGRNLLDNAAVHVGQPILVKLDLLHFFGSIHFPSVFRAIDRTLSQNPEIAPYFKESNGKNAGSTRADSFNALLSFFFTTFCTLDGILPQGSPASPMLSNLVFFPLDQQIAAFCGQRHIHYTRYSDDLTFSGDFSPEPLIRFVYQLLRENGFLLNPAKTIIARQGRRQQVTGILVNDHPQVGRDYRRRIRQEVHYLRRFGVASHLLHEGQTGWALHPAPYLQSLLGRIQFVLQICPYDREFLEYRAYVLRLLKSSL